MNNHFLKKMLSTVAVSSMLLTAVPSGATDLKEAVDGDYGYLENLYKWFHANPELSFQEDDTSARVAAELEKLGIDVTTGVGGYGVVGVLENGTGPTVLVRADMDGLPVPEKSGKPYASKAIGKGEQGEDLPVMHACGHDVHMTSMIGTARRLVDMKDQWSGTVVFVGQPAEERVGGAIAMIEDGLFERFPLPDYNLALHVGADEAGKVGITPGYALANVDTVDITVYGIGGHGSTPHLTKDPVVIASQIIVALQTIVSREISPQEPGVITVGSFHAGLKHNIISDRAELKLTVRSYSDETRAKLLEGIKRISENMGRVAGLPEDMLPKVHFREEEHAPATYNDPDLTLRMEKTLTAAIGEDLVARRPAVMGAEDFSHFSRTEHKIPSFIFWMGGYNKETIESYSSKGEKVPANHSPYFAPDPEKTLRIGTQAMTAAVLDLLSKK